MTATLISLISILAGIVGAIVTGSIQKKHSFGNVGNSIAGVFGSIFLIKSIGRLGFDPNSIVLQGETDLSLFALNVIVSFLGGAIAVILISKLKRKLNQSDK